MCDLIRIPQALKAFPNFPAVHRTGIAAIDCNWIPLNTEFLVVHHAKKVATVFISPKDLIFLMDHAPDDNRIERSVLPLDLSKICDLRVYVVSLPMIC